MVQAPHAWAINPSGKTKIRNLQYENEVGKICQREILHSD